MLFMKGDRNPKHFSFFVFYFNVSNEISYAPPRLIDFQTTPRLLSFEEFSTLSPFIPTPLL